MKYRIIGMRLNRMPVAAPPVPAADPTAVVAAASIVETATIDLEPVAAAGTPAVNAQVIVTDWEQCQLGGLYELAPTPIAAEA